MPFRHQRKLLLLLFRRWAGMHTGQHTGCFQRKDTLSLQEGGMHEFSFDKRPARSGASPPSAGASRGVRLSDVVREAIDEQFLRLRPGLSLMRRRWFGVCWSSTRMLLGCRPGTMMSTTGAERVWLEVFEWLTTKYVDHEPAWADGCLAVLSGRHKDARVWTYDREFRKTWRRPIGTVIPPAVKSI
jgi:hypothetical protein